MRRVTPTIDSEVAAHADLANRIRTEPGYVGTVLRSRARTNNSQNEK